MTVESELSKTWMDALRLRQEGKAITANGGRPLTDVLEEQVWEEADRRIDKVLTKRRMLKEQGKKVIPEWERDWIETEHIIFDARDFKESGVRKNGS